MCNYIYIDQASSNHNGLCVSTVIFQALENGRCHEFGQRELLFGLACGAGASQNLVNFGDLNPKWELKNTKILIKLGFK